MNKRYKIPSIYQKMQENGYTSIENYLWLNEMRWMPIDKILGYQHDEGESELILPFAITGGGDKWVWIVDEENEEYKVGLCERGEFNGIYYAKNTEDAIMRQIIEFVSDSNFYLSETNAKNYQISECELKQMLQKWKNSFTGILNERYLNIIDILSRLCLKHIKSPYGEWYALLSLDERQEMLDKYISFDLLDEEFEWYME